VPFWDGPLSDVSARAIFSFKFGIAGLASDILASDILDIFSGIYIIPVHNVDIIDSDRKSAAALK
jgi:hypothetical protein